MKTTAKAVVVVLMSMITSVVTAQTTSSKNEQTPAVLTPADTAAISARLSEASAKEFGMLSQDSIYFRELLANGNEPIGARVAGSGKICGTMVEAGDSVCLFIIRTIDGFRLFCDVIRPVEKKVVAQPITAYVASENTKEVYFDNENKDAEGNTLSRPFLGLEGGGTYLFTDKDIRPTFRAILGWEKKHWIVFTDFDISWKGYNVSDKLTENGVLEGAEVRGNYTTFNAALGFAWKVWQDARYRSFIAPKAKAGYSYAKTDGDNEAIRFSSSFYGFVWEAGMIGKWGISQHWGLTFDLSVGNVARNYHDSPQDMRAIGLKFLGGISYTF